MAVLRYFHQDPRQTSVQESSVIDKQGTVLTQKLTTINQSITNNTQVLEDKQNSVPGKSLSTNDFTDEYKNKLRGIEEGAEVNVQSDWGEDDNTADSYIKNKPVIDDIVTQNSENLITSGAVFTAIDELPEPMIFKGSLGVGGTIQTLPAPSADNVGFVYKVITAGTYYGITAKPGDSFISDSSDWILIPSGDEPEGTVMSVGLTVPTGLQVSGSPITTSGTLAITYALGYAIPTTAKQDEWDAKQNAISDLSTIRTNASNGNTAYGWGNHANAGYVKSSGVTSVAMTVPTGLSVSGSPITSTGTLALSFANGYSIPTTAKQSNWDTAYGWGNHASAGYLKSITKAMVTTALGYTPPQQDTNTTYSIATGDNNGQIKVTPSSGNAYNVSVKGLGSRAYDSTSYLPLAGGTMVAGSMINWADWGQWGKSNATYPKAQGGLRWSGTSDWIQLNAEEVASDDIRLILAFGDDASPSLDIRNNTGTTTMRLLSSGQITAASFVKSGGTSSQFLKADGSVDSNTYATSSSLGNYLPLTGGTLSNGNWGQQLTLKRQGGTPSLYFNDGTYSYYFYPSMSKDNEWHVGQTYNNKDYILWHNGNFNPANYLPLTGGTLTGRLNVNESTGDSISINSSQTWACALYHANAGDVWAVGANTGNRFYFYNGYNAAIVSYFERGGNLVCGGVSASGTSNRLIFRHLDGQNCNGNYDLYLQYHNTNSKTYFNGGTYYIQGGTYNGTASNAGTVYQTYSNGASNYRVLLGYPDSNNGYKNVYKNDFFYANPNVKKVYIDGSLYFTNTGNSSGGWNVYSQSIGLRILDDTGSSDRGAPSNYYATGLHVGGQYWFQLAFERGDNRLLYRGGNAEGVTRSWSRIHTYGDNEYACAGKMYIQCGDDDGNVIIGANQKNDDSDGPWVGIGKMNPSYKLHVNGACGATSHPTTSDIRIKDIQSDVSINLEDIANAPLFLFKWKEGGDNLTHVGTSAQYWKEKVPELVSEANDERKTLSLEYEVLGTAGSIAIAKEVVSLKEEIKLLQAQIAELKQLLNN